MIIVCKYRLHPVDVFNFLMKVEFTVERRGEMLEDRLHIHDLIEGRSLPDFLSKYFEQGKILFDVGSGHGPLNFDDHSVTGLERGPVDLRDCPGRERLGIDRLKHVLPRHPQFLLGDPNDLTLGHGGGT